MIYRIHRYSNQVGSFPPKNLPQITTQCCSKGKAMLTQPGIDYSSAEKFGNPGCQAVDLRTLLRM